MCTVLRIFVKSLKLCIHYQNSQQSVKLFSPTSHLHIVVHAHQCYKHCILRFCYSSRSKRTMSSSTQKLCTKCPSKYVIFQALGKTHIYRAKPAYGDDVITMSMKGQTTVKYCNFWLQNYNAEWSPSDSLFFTRAFSFKLTGITSLSLLLQQSIQSCLNHQEQFVEACGVKFLQCYHGHSHP